MAQVDRVRLSVRRGGREAAIAELSNGDVVLLEPGGRAKPLSPRPSDATTLPLYAGGFAAGGLLPELAATVTAVSPSGDAEPVVAGDGVWVMLLTGSQTRVEFVAESGEPLLTRGLSGETGVSATLTFFSRRRHRR